MYWNIKYMSHNKAYTEIAGGAGGAGEIPVAPVLFVENLSGLINELKSLIEVLKLVVPDDQIILLVQVEKLKDVLIGKALSIAPYAVDVPESFLRYMSCLSVINNERSYLAEKQDELENLRYLAEIASIDSERTEVGAMQAVEALKKVDFPRKEIDRVSTNLEKYNAELRRLGNLFIDEIIV